MSAYFCTSNWCTLAYQVRFFICISKYTVVTEHTAITAVTVSECCIKAIYIYIIYIYNICNFYIKYITCSKYTYIYIYIYISIECVESFLNLLRYKYFRQRRYEMLLLVQVMNNLLRFFKKYFLFILLDSTVISYTLVSKWAEGENLYQSIALNRGKKFVRWSSTLN